jgi:hypothetical protein
MPMKKFLLLLLIIIALVGCSKKKQDSHCTKKYENKKFGATIYHSENWTPYEFQEHYIGMEYEGIGDFERRYDAEIIIAFIDGQVNEQKLYSFYSNTDRRKSEVQSKGGTYEAKAVDKGTKEFADREWRAFWIEQKAAMKDEPKAYESTETNYVWYSSSRSIVITVTVKGRNNIKGLDAEVECVLSNMQIKD